MDILLEEEPLWRSNLCELQVQEKIDCLSSRRGQTRKGSLPQPYPLLLSTPVPNSWDLSVSRVSRKKTDPTDLDDEPCTEMDKQLLHIAFSHGVLNAFKDFAQKHHQKVSIINLFQYLSMVIKLSLPKISCRPESNVKVEMVGAALIAPYVAALPASIIPVRSKHQNRIQDTKLTFISRWDGVCFIEPFPLRALTPRGLKAKNRSEMWNAGNGDGLRNVKSTIMWFSYVFFPMMIVNGWMFLSSPACRVTWLWAIELHFCCNFFHDEYEAHCILCGVHTYMYKIYKHEPWLYTIYTCIHLIEFVNHMICPFWICDFARATWRQHFLPRVRPRRPDVGESEGSNPRHRWCLSSIQF